MSLIVRPARPEDWRAWRELRLRALAEAPDAFAQTLADVRDGDDAAWQSWVRPRNDAIRLFAERDGVPIGQMVVIIAADDPRRANVYAMWVAPEARRTGLGR
ncbi:MAG TPA: GNAT family N-acetyltransferase [Kofleriaceae bacterium]|nr:GNAT family N-acetyltransferase [Kofleriaceae bacterium]